MKRSSYFLTEQQAAVLRAISEKTGLSVSEIIRRALDEYLERYAAKEKARAG